MRRSALLPSSDLSEGMSYLDTLPRRVVTVYIPLAVFIIVLLFPFYWMGVTTFKPNEELYNFSDHNPFWISSPTLANISKLLFETDYPQWLLNTMTVAVCATFLSIFASVLAAYAITRLRFRGAQTVGLLIFLAYLVPPSILFIPLATMVYGLGIYDTNWALILTYPTFLIPFCTWLLMGYFKSIPYELEECALIDGATRIQILWKITLPLARAGSDLGRNLRLHPILERVYLRAGVHFLDRAEDGPSWRSHRTGRGRRLSLGLADGGCASWLASGGDLLFILRRALRRFAYRRRQRVAADTIACPCAGASRVGS